MDAQPHNQQALASEIVIHRPGVLRPISWGALFGGVVMSLAFQLLLTTLGIGIGLSTLSPGQGNGGNSDPGMIGLGAGLWWGITYLISLLIGGYVAARLCGMAGRIDGVLHGLVTWGFTLLITFYLLTTAAGSVIGGAFSVVGKAISASGTALKPVTSQATAGLSPEELQNEARQLLQPTNPSQMTPEQAQRELVADLGEMVAGGRNAPQARDRAITLLSAQLNISRDQATQKLDQWQARFNQFKQNAVQTVKQTAGAAANTVSHAAIWTFVALILGAVTGALGGAWGTRHYVAEATR